ncbi:MAG: hypothetical protein JXQ67_07005 [Campylobacterales bacterium]|nr:hypothetical protein [Campylobacterales bacterium]
MTAELVSKALMQACEEGDVVAVKESLAKGAKTTSLFKYTLFNLESTEILQLLLESGFNIYADVNEIVSHWMGGWRDSRPTKLVLLDFFCSYYLQQADALERFSTLILNKSLLFRLGLDDNNINIMKFAVLIGMQKSVVLFSALNRYYTNNSTYKKIDYEIIEYLLSLEIELNEENIARAVCFGYTEIIETLSSIDELEYGYEMAYLYNKADMCQYFIGRGVSKEAQNFTKMKIAAMRGDVKILRKVVNDGAELAMIDEKSLVEIIRQNRAEVLEYLYESGFVFSHSLQEHFYELMHNYTAYDALSYLFSIGFDITTLKSLPREYKKHSPAFADMFERGIGDVFDYTLYLAKELYPNVDQSQKELLLQRVAELSTLPYVRKKSEEKSRE